MPPRNNSLPRLRRNATPPPVMTMRKALPVIVVAGVFDLLRAFFEMFWFFGPALAALYCTYVASNALSSWTFGLLGAGTAGLVCTAGAAAVGAAGVEAIAPIGVIMADAVGIIGFLTLGLWIVMSNVRILKAVRTAPLQFAGAFAVAEIPFIGTLPLFSFILWRLYRTQIQAETAALRKFEEEQQALLLQEQRQQMLGAAQVQAAQQADIQQEDLLRREEEQYAELQAQQAANDEQYEIPDEVRSAA